MNNIWMIFHFVFIIEKNYKEYLHILYDGMHSSEVNRKFIAQKKVVFQLICKGEKEKVKLSF